MAVQVRVTVSICWASLHRRCSIHDRHVQCNLCEGGMMVAVSRELSACDALNGVVSAPHNPLSGCIGAEPRAAGERQSPPSDFAGSMPHAAGPFRPRRCTPPAGIESNPAASGSSTPVSSTAPPWKPSMPLVGPASTPSEPEGVRALENELALVARRTWRGLPAADVGAAVDAGMLAAAAEAADGVAHSTDGTRRLGSGEAVDAAAVEVAAAAAVIQRQGLPLGESAAVDWSGFGVVLPVLAGSPGAGASVLTALLADALQLAHRNVLLIDPADPPRSGLAIAARSNGPWLTKPHPQVHIRFSWRARALVARLETALPVIAPGMVPPPRFWLPQGPRPEITVVDLGHDPWRVAAHPLLGAGAWLRRGTPSPLPVLVVRPSRPSLLHAEQVLARLDHWVVAGAVSPPVQLVVMGAKRWPAGVAGAAGRRVCSLLESAVFVPHDPELAAAGVTAAVTPLRLRQAITPLLSRWGLLPHAARGWQGSKGRP